MTPYLNGLLSSRGIGLGGYLYNNCTVLRTFDS